MELDNLKTIWKGQDVLDEPEPDQTEMLIWLMTRQSRGPIAHMRRNLRRESLLMIATYIPTILGYLLLLQGRLWVISLVYFLILVFFGIYYYKKSRLLRDMECVTCEVRSNLARQLDRLGRYVNFYRWSGTLLIVIALIIGYMVIAYTYRHVHPLSAPGWWLHPAFLAALLVPFALGAHFLNRWYVNKLYGRHIQKLRDLLREMDEV